MIEYLKTLINPIPTLEIFINSEKQNRFQYIFKIINTKIIYKMFGTKLYNIGDSGRIIFSYSVDQQLPLKELTSYLPMGFFTYNFKDNSFIFNAGATGFNIILDHIFELNKEPLYQKINNFNQINISDLKVLQNTRTEQKIMECTMMQTNDDYFE